MRKALLILGAVLLLVLPGACGGGDEDSEEVITDVINISGQYQAVYETNSAECSIAGVTDVFPVGGEWAFAVSRENENLTLTMEGGLAYQGVILSNGEFAATATTGGEYASGGVTTTVYITYVFSGTYQDSRIRGTLNEKDVYQNSSLGDYQCLVEYEIWAVKGDESPSP